MKVYTEDDDLELASFECAIGDKWHEAKLVLDTKADMYYAIATEKDSQYHAGNWRVLWRDNDLRKAGECYLVYVDDLLGDKNSMNAEERVAEQKKRNQLTYEALQQSLRTNEEMLSDPEYDFDTSDLRGETELIRSMIEELKPLVEFV